MLEETSEDARGIGDISAPIAVRIAAGKQDRRRLARQRADGAAVRSRAQTGRALPQGEIGRRRIDEERIRADVALARRGLALHIAVGRVDRAPRVDQKLGAVAPDDGIP